MTSGDEGEGAVSRILRRAGAEVGAGRPWRAREILQGALRGHATDPRILEAYGRVLDRLGDRVEAGKYLFLSGLRGPEVEGAIDVFLARHGNGYLGDLTARFPRGIRNAGLDALPPVVRADLEALDLPEGRGKREGPAPVEAVPPNLSAFLWLLGCAVGVVVLAVLAVVGLVTLVRWIF